MIFYSTGLAGLVWANSRISNWGWYTWGWVYHMALPLSLSVWVHLLEPGSQFILHLGKPSVAHLAGQKLDPQNNQSTTKNNQRTSKEHDDLALVSSLNFMFRLWPETPL